ncbi:two component LuxR family transcriptional regulator [Caballeronia choica]|uniref:Two component LuxR family transcriptional regulator n=1 Tax=Caballeronia choica TaxID=326476 RepID=A0A158KLU6_9BURK|nr:response regulator [Caballeronia choica]SAL82107.1 two component LuxR family transcriptional regulator [Caballeronia choica]
MYRILLAEEQPATREAVRARLEKAGYEVVQEVNDGPTALRRTLDLKPDLLVLSLRLPRLGGLEVLRRMRQHGTKTKSLVMTSADSQHVVGMCMQAGASGFVSKTDDLSEITLAVQAISRNHTFFPGLQTAHGKSDPRMLTEAEQIASLSAREVTVLSYLADGYANRDICQALSLNSRTISTYKTRLFRKLNIASVVELAEVAKRNHILGRGVTGEERRGELAWPLADDGYKVLRSVLDAIPSALSIRDPTGKLLFANKFLLGRYEKEERELIGTALTEVEGLDSRQATKLQTNYIAAVQRAVPFNAELVVRFKGERHALLCWGSPLFDATGVLKAMVCGVQNVQAQELTFLQLRAAKEQAEASSTAKSLLLVEHAESFRNQIELLSRALSPIAEGEMRAAALRRAAQEALAATEALRSQLDNLQALIASSNSATQTVREPCNLVDILKEVIAALEARYASQEARITFDDSLADAADVWLDPRRFRQVTSSLLSQRLVNTKKPVLAVSLRTEARSRALVFVEIDWKDASGRRPPRKPSSATYGMQVGAALAESLGAEFILMSQAPVHLLLRFTVPRAVAARHDDLDRYTTAPCE